MLNPCLNTSPVLLTFAEKIAQDTLLLFQFLFRSLTAEDMSRELDMLLLTFEFADFTYVKGHPERITGSNQLKQF